MAGKSVALAKLLPEKYRESFLDGNLFMNTPAYFEQLEARDIVRCDPDEGLSESRHFKEVAVQAADGTWVPIQGIIGPVKFRTPQAGRYNMLCLYAHPDESVEPFDERNLAFGESFVLIHNVVEFIRRFREAAASLDRQYSHGLVEYVDPDVHDGPMGPFKKFRVFSYQNEFRFTIAGDGSPLMLKIGDLRDICSWGSSADLKRLFGR